MTGFTSLAILSLLGTSHAYVTVCQTYSTQCDATTAPEAIANLKSYLDNFGAQPAGADFYLWTGIIAGSSNLGTCGVQLISDAYYPGSIQANVTKVVFNQATLSVTYTCVLEGKQGSAALNDTSRFEGPTFTFWK